MDQKLRNIRETLYVLAGQALAHQMLCAALIATHNDRPLLLDAFMFLSKAADAHVGSSALLDPGAVQRHFDAAYNEIVRALRQLG